MFPQTTFSITGRSREYTLVNCSFAAKRNKRNRKRDWGNVIVIMFKFARQILSIIILSEALFREVKWAPRGTGSRGGGGRGEVGEGFTWPITGNRPALHTRERQRNVKDTWSPPFLCLLPPIPFLPLLFLRLPPLPSLFDLFFDVFSSRFVNINTPS